MADDALLHEDDVESALSIAYVHAVAAHAGYTCGEPPGPDRDSIDIQIAAGGHMRPKIDFQLKSTVKLIGSTTHYSYPLKLKNYNDLRAATQTPRALVVLDLPPNKADWLNITAAELVIKRAAYWVSLAGMDDTSNTTSVTIQIPKSNIFDVNALRTMMEKSRKGTLA